MTEHRIFSQGPIKSGLSFFQQLNLIHGLAKSDLVTKIDLDIF